MEIYYAGTSVALSSFDSEYYIPSENAKKCIKIKFLVFMNWDVGSNISQKSL
jgi:hypothetical protein